jgi:hypothetical protein
VMTLPQGPSYRMPKYQLLQVFAVLSLRVTGT